LHHPKIDKEISVGNEIKRITWTAGNAEGDAGREDADARIGRVLAQQLNQDDPAFHQRPKSRFAQPLNNNNKNTISHCYILHNSNYSQWNVCVCGIVTVISPVNAFGRIREPERTAVPDLSGCQTMNCRWPSIQNGSKNEIWRRRKQVKRPLDLRLVRLPYENTRKAIRCCVKDQ